MKNSNSSCEILKMAVEDVTNKMTIVSVKHENWPIRYATWEWQALWKCACNIKMSKVAVKH